MFIFNTNYSQNEDGKVERIYYLLFTTTAGACVDDIAMANILASFVDNVIEF